MKVRERRTEKILPVVAIIWPKSDHLRPIKQDFQTQFTVYDGHSLYDVVESEVEIIDCTLVDFVLNGTLDSRFFVVIWEPLSNSSFWQKVREYDRGALEELNTLMSRE